MIKPLMEKLAMALIGIIKEAELDSQMPTASKTAQQIETPGPTAGTPAKAAPEVAAKTPTETDNAQAVSPDAKGAVESRMVEGQVTRTAPAPSDPYKDQGRIDPSVKPTVDPSVDPSVKTG